MYCIVHHMWKDHEIHVQMLSTSPIYTLITRDDHTRHIRPTLYNLRRITYAHQHWLVDFLYFNCCGKHSMLIGPTKFSCVSQTPPTIEDGICRTVLKGSAWWQLTRAGKLMWFLVGCHANGCGRQNKQSQKCSRLNLTFSTCFPILKYLKKC